MKSVFLLSPNILKCTKNNHFQIGRQNHCIQCSLFILRHVKKKPEREMYNCPPTYFLYIFLGPSLELCWVYGENLHFDSSKLLFVSHKFLFLSQALKEVNDISLRWFWKQKNITFLVPQDKIIKVKLKTRSLPSLTSSSEVIKGSEWVCEWRGWVYGVSEAN
jgi:hypothetical protein